MIPREPGIPSGCKSAACVDDVRAICTHHPLRLLSFSEVGGLFAWQITLPGWKEDDQTVAFLRKEKLTWLNPSGNLIRFALGN